jgi:hypothetical protein
MQALYTRHSKKKGQPYETLDETLNHLRGIETSFWDGVQAYARKHWPLSWRAKMRALRALQIPTEEYDRIRALRRNS